MYAEEKGSQQGDVCVCARLCMRRGGDRRRATCMYVSRVCVTAGQIAACSQGSPTLHT